MDIGLQKDFLGKRLHVRLTGSDVFRTTNDYFYKGNYSGIEIDRVRSFNSQWFGASATWKFGNQRVKAAKRSRMESCSTSLWKTAHDSFALMQDGAKVPIARR